MAYSSGSVILDDDYNIFATGNAAGTGDNNVANINSVWGAGTGDKGYGQTNTVSAVSAGSTITATQWATLLNRISSAANHQGTTITSITNPVAGDTIEAYAALQSNVTSIFNNRLNADASGTDASASHNTTSTWSTSASTTKTITFGSATQLRYFFNAGGMIRVNFSLTGGSDDKSTSWATLLSNVGTIVLTGSGTSKSIAGTTYTGTTKIGGGGTPSTLLTGTGALDLTTTPTTIFQQSASTYLYTANYARIQASVNSNVLTLSVLLQDDAIDETTIGGAEWTGNPADDIVDGTLTMTTVIRPPSTTYITNTWGTPAQNSATWTVS